MRKHANFRLALAIILHLIQLIATTKPLRTYQILSADQTPDTTYKLTELHWKLFRWYFLRAPYIALTPLRSEASNDLDKFHTELYTELSKGMQEIFSFKNTLCLLPLYFQIKI